MQDSTIVCLVRDEAPYLLEWIAWYKLLGADRLVFYDNGSTDEGPVTLRGLQAAGEIDYVSWPDRPGFAPQLDAYEHAAAACRTSWIGFLDIDEFLVLPRHDGLPDFLAGFPEECGAVVCNQRVVGSNGLAGFAPGLVLERFPLGAPESLSLNVWVKSMARMRCLAAPHIHAPRLREGAFFTADGEPVKLRADGRQTPFPSHRTAYYNHYIVKSVEEYENKRRRGDSTTTPETVDRAGKYSDAFFEAHDVARFPDPNVEQALPSLRREIERLQSLALISHAGAPRGWLDRDGFPSRSPSRYSA